MSAISPSRRVAFAVLRRVFEDGAYADRALAVGVAVPRRARPRPRASARLRHHQRGGTLDHAIESLGRRPARKLDPPVRAAFGWVRTSSPSWTACPRYAAVNESVELVRSARLERAEPFANAVLRRLADGAVRCARHSPIRNRRRGGPAALVSGPGRRDVVARARRRQARAFMAAQNEEPETAVEGVRGAIDGRADPLIPGAWVVDRVDETALAEGRIWPQSRGSQLVGHVVGSLAAERTLDLCAAPGGKATMLAGEVVAVEVDKARAEQLEQNVRRLGATGVRVVGRDGRDLPLALQDFDRALVDAPCSASVCSPAPRSPLARGTVAGAQRKLLRAAIDRTRAGGTLVYSTCTINAEESEEVVDAAVADGGVEVDATLGDEWPSFRHTTRAELLQTLPHVHGTSGFFVARLRVT